MTPKNKIPGHALLNKNVSQNWKPVEQLEKRKTGMMFSDRIFYWLVMLGGLALIAVGIFCMWTIHPSRIGAALIGIGVVVFAMGPSQAARNGYRL